MCSSMMAHCHFVMGHGCTLTKSFTVLAWQLTTANIKHVLSLGWEWESARDSPDRTNKWWWGGFPSCCFLFTAPPPHRLLQDRQWFQSVTCLCNLLLCHLCAFGALWFVCNDYIMVFQVYKHINVEVGRETRTRHAAYYSWWEIGKDSSLFNVSRRLVFVWSAVFQLIC